MEVSEKNTKAEILKAYEILLKNVQTAKADVPKEKLTKRRKSEEEEYAYNLKIKRQKEQHEQLKENTDKANRAEANVKDIAVKAIENASKIRMFPSKSEKEDN